MPDRDYFPQRLNLHVPDMQYASDLAYNGVGQFSLGTPATKSSTAILNAAAITNAASTITTGLPASVGDLDDCPYGRAIVVTGGTAADDAVVTVNGRDYLNQPMAEKFTLSGTAAVNGKKAFMYVDSVDIGAGNANATSTVSVGTLDVFGLPYRAVALLTSLIDKATAAAFTFVAGAGNGTTDATTEGTADTRGTVAPGTAANGTHEFGVLCLFDRTNLHGIVRAA